MNTEDIKIHSRSAMIEEFSAQFIRLSKALDETKVLLHALGATPPKWPESTVAPDTSSEVRVARARVSTQLPRKAGETFILNKEIKDILLELRSGITRIKVTEMLKERFPNEPMVKDASIASAMSTMFRKHGMLELEFQGHGNISNVYRVSDEWLQKNGHGKSAAPQHFQPQFQTEDDIG